MTGVIRQAAQSCPLGASVDETADVLQVSTQTVIRDWRVAKAWLARELRGE